MCFLFCARDSAIQVSQNDREIENRKPKNIVREHIKTQKAEVKIMADELRNEQTESENLENNQQEVAEQERQEGEQENVQKEQSNEQEGKEPTVQELMVELAKLKRAQEKAASEAAEYKKKYNAKLSEKEKADEEKARIEAEKDEQFQQLVRENKINKLEKSYLSLGYTADEASKMAVAEVDEDLEAKLKIQLSVKKRWEKEQQAEFYKSRPELNAGVGDKQITKEQFDNMGLAEKSKLYNENKAEYDRLMGM